MRAANFIDVLKSRKHGINLPFQWGPWNSKSCQYLDICPNIGYTLFSFKGTVAPLWVWLKVVRLEIPKVEEELLMFSKFSIAPTTFNNVNRHAALFLTPATFHQSQSPELPLKATHVRDFIVGFSHFLASFNNRQDQGPEFQNLLKLNVILLHKWIFINNTFSPKTHCFTLCFWWKHCISLCIPAENA